MQEVCCYHIMVAGQAQEKEFITASPLSIRVEQIDPEATRLAVSTDQSGLIGLLRFLHQRGFVLLSVIRSETTACERERGI